MHFSWERNGVYRFEVQYRNEIVHCHSPFQWFAITLFPRNLEHRLSTVTEPLDTNVHYSHYDSAALDESIRAEARVQLLR